MVPSRFVLVRPQLGENIGKAARAMLNFGQEHMCLVAPRDGWPNPSAGPSASGADHVLDNASVHETVADAVSDCNFVLATTARPRDMAKPVYDLKAGAKAIAKAEVEGQKTAILFGPERSGLENDDLNLADGILTVDLNPKFASLNLAQAVVLVAYELFSGDRLQDHGIIEMPFEGALADKAALDGLLGHLEAELTPRGFFRSEGRRASQMRTLYNLVTNSGFSPQEVQTLRGIIKTLVRDMRDVPTEG